MEVANLIMSIVTVTTRMQRQVLEVIQSWDLLRYHAHMIVLDVISIVNSDAEFFQIRW